jgi:hypothetical protein
MLTSVSLAYLSSSGDRALREKVEAEAKKRQGQEGAPRAAEPKPEPAPQAPTPAGEAPPAGDTPAPAPQP